jgi:tetratricopeptide (TPR) repeat protein
MTHISIRERGTGHDGDMNAVVIFDHGEEYPIIITDPFTEGEEKRLEWYFEEHLRFPFTHQVRAQEAASSISAYGEALFNQVFADRKAYARYHAALQVGVENLALEIAGSPDLHSLHWEALKDPDMPQPLALQVPMVRRNLTPLPVHAEVHDSPTINLLVVTARPGGARDVGYRTISRPLVEGLRQVGLPVRVEILRPGTYRALVDRLAAAQDTYGTGYYHVIHFDVHGALLSYEQFQAGAQSGRLLSRSRYGRGDIAPYDDRRAFLFLESDIAGQSDLVEAQELADLLMVHQVPIVILNACQSGKQVRAAGRSSAEREDGPVERRETSLGSRLMTAGVQMVLAMGYSVTVTAAELLMTTLYRQLFSGQDLTAAICRGRLELYNNKRRRVYFDQLIDLEDWLLPVVYQNLEQRLRLRDFTPDESAAYYERRARRYRPPEVTYGFVGRDLDVLQIERRLLTRRNVLLIRGMGGAGKSTLLHHLAAWWQATGFVDRVCYFGYDERAWTRQQVMNAVARELMTEAEYLATFQPLGSEAQQALLGRRLCATRHLLILDNLESITGSHLAIQNTLPEEERQRLQGFLCELAGGRTLVLLGSRGGEGWLAPGTFAQNVYDLPGLDPEAASTLADRILERHQATQYRQDEDLLRLLNLLDGYPLPIEVVLASLARQSPAEVLAALHAGDEAMDMRSESKTESILRCIDYSHANLSPKAQQLLSCLAPFTAVFDTDSDILSNYTAHLRQQPPLAQLPFERWPEVLQEAADWGLVGPHPQVPVYLRLQPILPYFLRARLAGPEEAKVRQAIETAFRLHYDDFGRSVAGLFSSKDAQQRRLGQVVAHLEYENLVTALNLALQAQVSILGPYQALSCYLDVTQDQRRGLELGETVLACLESYSDAALTGQLGAEFVGVLDDIAKRQLLLEQLQAAEASYRKALSLHQGLTIVEGERKALLTAGIYHDLGVVVQEQRQWVQAEACYRQALEIFREFNDLYGQAGTYYQLGRVAQQQRQWAQAELCYQKTLEIHLECNLRYEQAEIYHQLGVVAQHQRQWVQAEQYLYRALRLYFEFKDRHSQALVYGQLGRLAEGQRQWAQAEQYYQQALEILIEFDDRPNQALTYHQLGVVAQQQRQWVQAELYYQKTIEICREFNNHYAQAKAHHQMGTVAVEQQKWALAEQHYRQALQIYVACDDRFEKAKIYHNLGVVAQEQQQWTQAEAYYQQALEIWTELNECYEQASTYHQLGVVAQHQQQWVEAEQYYQEALEIFIEFDDRYHQSTTYHNLGLVALQQRRWAQARDYLLKDLAITAEFGDDREIGITLHSLARLWQVSEDAGLPAAVAAVLGIDLEEAEKRLAAS